MRYDAPIQYRYELVIKFYDENFNVTSVKTELYRLRRQAEDRAKEIKNQHSQDKIVSTIDIIKIETGESVGRLMSKHAKKKKKSRRSHKR